MERIGRFTVIRELGHGGMGSVYLCRDPELQRDVAIKLLHRTAAGVSNARAQFREEARTLAKVSHPNIVAIFEIGDHEGAQYLVMEYLSGKSLRELLSTPGLTPPRARLLEIVTGVARALAAAHQRGILHRDIKPENVMVGDAVKVVDFGLARRLGVVSLPPSMSVTSLEKVSLDQTIKMLVEGVHDTVPGATAQAGATVATAAPNGTVAGTLFGTPAYMAPEVLQGEPASRESDLYSLGVLLYECLGGRRPHEAASLVELIARVIEGSEQPAPLTDPLGGLVARMLARDPAARPSLDDVIAELSPAPVAVVALPPVVVRRRRWPLVTGFALAVAAIAVAFAVTRSNDPPVHGISTVLVDRIVARVPAWSDNPAWNIESVVSPLLTRDTIAPVTKPEAAAFVVSGRIEQDAASAIGVVSVRRTDARAGVVFAARGEVKRLPSLIGELSTRVAAWLDPASPSTPNPAQGHILLEQGRDLLNRGAWHHARLHLEQAVQVDPNSVEGWSLVASARGWTVAPAELMNEAIANTIRLETDPTQRQIWIGAAHFYRDEQRRAIEVLAPLDSRTDLSATARINLDNYLGEAYWHDGQPSRAIVYFKRLLGRNPPFLPVRAHAYDYAIDHGELETAARLYGIEHPMAELQIARGELAVVAEQAEPPWKLYAQIVLGQRVEPAAFGNVRGRAGALFAYAEASDDAVAMRQLRVLHDDVAAAPVASLWDDLAQLVEIAIVRERPDELRAAIELERARGVQPFRSYRRHELLVSAILGEPDKVDRDRLSTRELLIADAVEAERAGNHALAAERFGALVKDPFLNWDYPERAALIRNLAAAGDLVHVRAECAALRKPHHFRMAWIPLDRTCRRLLATAPRKRR